MLMVHQVRDVLDSGGGGKRRGQWMDAAAMQIRTLCFTSGEDGNIGDVSDAAGEDEGIRAAVAMLDPSAAATQCLKEVHLAQLLCPTSAPNINGGSLTRDGMGLTADLTRGNMLWAPSQ